MRFKPVWIPFLFAFLAGLLLVGLGPQRQGVASGKTPVTAHTSVSESYGKLPLSFEVNQGQTDARVKFLSRGNGYTWFLTPTEAVLSLSKPVPSEPHSGISTEAPRKELSDKKPLATTVLRIKLLGANPATWATGLDELPGKSNYFIGSDPKKWHANVPNYGRVKVHDVYPGVDLMYYGNQRQLEEDFVVAPGADPRAVTMEIAGAEKVSIDARGELVLANSGGKLHLRKPVVYQRAGGLQHEIAGGYKLKGENRVAFELGEYDVRKPLVIDPVLVYSTYLGGGNGEQGSGIAVDSAGSAYVAGQTSSTNFPTTSGTFQTTSGGGTDAFVTKLNAAGSALVYSTYLGGSGNDQGTGIAIDSSGNAYVTGVTTSTNFPTTSGGFQTTYGGGVVDAFVTELNATGSALVYSTYLGSSSVDVGRGIAVDSAGSAYVTGFTDSTDFPTTSGAFQTSIGGCRDAFVTKLNAAGSALVYSTYLGGSGCNFSEHGFAIAVDSAGSAYVTGDTDSTNFPTTTSAFQTTSGGGAFVTKLNAAGSGLVYSTYLGGSGGGNGAGIAVDSTGSAYVTGSTNSTNFPATSSAFQTTFGGGTDAFVTKLNATGSALVYSTYLGGSSKDQGFGIAVDSTGSAYVTGDTDSTNFPATSSAFQTTFGGGGGGADAFVTKLNPTGSALVYSTFLGGSETQAGFGIAVDSARSTYVTGFTGSTDFPTTSGAFQTTAGGVSNTFEAKIAEANTPAGTNVAVQPTDTATGTAPATLTFSSVTQVGFTNLATSSSGPMPPAGFGLGSPATYYSLTTTAIFTGPITVCINYAGISFTSGPQLFHFEGGNWVDVTSSVDTVNQIACGSVTSLSPFALFQSTIRGLMALVNSFNLPHGTANSLLAKLRNAQASVASGNLTAACNQLNAFINEVEAQSGKKITTNQANQLIVAANGVKAGLGCS